MTEIELKLQVPAHAQRAVDTAVGRGRAQRTHLRAVYYDTPDRRLAAAGIALRVRQEGRTRVQTVKAAGGSLLERLEHNVVLPGQARNAADVLAVDPARHAGTAVGAVLDAALAPRAGEPAAPLEAVYRTDIRRHHRSLRTTGGVVELAYDVGAILAGDRRMPVSELEIELVRGRPEVVVDVARRWAARHGLWIDPCSKAERGERLGRGLDQAPAVKAMPIALDADAAVDDAARSVVASCLVHVLSNAGEIAGARHRDEHVHQMRVGLRRLRTALRLFDGWAAGIDPAWSQEVAAVFRQLGGQRDRDALEATVLPRLRAAGAPCCDPFGSSDADATGDPALVARSAAFTDLALRLQRFVTQAAPAQAAAGDALRAGLKVRLERWHRQVQRDARRFETLTDEARHRLRRRVKRLRYAVEFVAGLYGRRAVGRYLARLAPTQEQLGAYNDLCVATELFSRAVTADPRAWFALGWLNATRTDLVPTIARTLGGLRRARPFWD